MTGRRWYDYPGSRPADNHNLADTLCPICDGDGCKTCQHSGVVIGLVRAGLLRQQRDKR